MLSDDLFKTDWDSLDIHFSSDRRIDEQGLLKLSHMRYVKRLSLYQDGPATNFYTPGLFRNVHLNRLYVQHLIIHSANFNKTKALLHVMRRAHVSILEIIFDDVSAESQGYVYGSAGMPISKIVVPSHVIFTNVRQRDTHKIKWLLDKFDGDLSAIWLQKVHKEVTKLTLLKHIDNLHVCMGFPFAILDPIKITNLYIHANSLSDIQKFDEAQLLPLVVSSVGLVPKIGSSVAQNVIVESVVPSTSYLVKVNGRDVYDLHVSRDNYSAHRPIIKHKSIVQHQKIPTNWAVLYLPVP